MLIGYFDYAIFAILILLNIKLWKRNFVGFLAILIGICLFGLVLPMLSIFIEIYRVESAFEIVDGYQLIYTYFRFPMYWLFGLIQALVNILKWSFRSLAH